MEESHETEASPLIGEWIDEQDRLKKKLITSDEFEWTLPSVPPSLTSPSSSASSLQTSLVLKYVGGVDMSFYKEDTSMACACLVVLELPALQVVYTDFSLLRLEVPYIPGFLAFREAPVLLQLLSKMKKNHSHLYPQVLMVDGNGILHPRGFGLACHLGVRAGIPTVGIGKNLHHVDGLTQFRVRQLLELEENKDEDSIMLTGNSGFTWGAGLRPTPGSRKPIYISVGHRLSLDSAIRIVKLTCKYRVPEPIRQADISSRAYLQSHQKEIVEKCSCSRVKPGVVWEEFPNVCIICCWATLRVLCVVGPLRAVPPLVGVVLRIAGPRGLLV